MDPTISKFLFDIQYKVNKTTVNLIINTLLGLMKKEKIRNPTGRIHPEELRRLSLLVVLGWITLHNARKILADVFYNGGLVEDKWREYATV